MNVVDIKSFDVNNGEGVRVSLWVAGCPHKCKGCHNEESWDENAGVQLENGMVINILKELESIKNFSVLGGEPLAPYNIEDITSLCKLIKEIHPHKSIWLWTGYDWEDIAEYDIMQYLDVVVDGAFIEDLQDGSLLWRGSKNQRVIDVQKTKLGDEIYEISEDEQ